MMLLKKMALRRAKRRAHGPEALLMAHGRDLPREVQLELGAQVEFVVDALAGNPSLEHDIAHQLLAVPAVRKSLASNPSICAEIQSALVTDEDDYVRHYLAQNERVTGECQLVLARDPEPHVRRALAGNKALAARAQRVLVRGEPHVLVVLAANPALEPRLQGELAHADSITVQAALAENPSLLATDSMPVAFLEMGTRGRAHLEEVLSRFPVTDREALATGFAGTLTELVAVLASFSAAH